MTRLSRWLFGTLISLALIALVQVEWMRVVSSSVDILGVPDIGRLAPPRYQWADDWIQIGEAPISERVLGIASYQDTVFLLQQHGWSKIAAHQVFGPFGRGDSLIGKRDTGGNAIAIAKGKVYILNAKRQTVSIWDSRGQLLKRLRYDKTMPTIQGATELRVDNLERIYLTVRLFPRPANANWALLRFSPHTDSPAILYPPLASRESLGMMDTFAFDIDAKGGAVIARANDFKFQWLDPSGESIRERRRAAAPFWRIPQSQRAQYSKLLKKLPPAMQADYQLPEYAPAVRDVALEAGGRLIIMTTTPGNRVIIELCDNRGQPLGRISRETLPESSTFLTRQGIFRLRESSFGRAVIEVRYLRLPVPPRAEK